MYLLCSEPRDRRVALEEKMNIRGQVCRAGLIRIFRNGRNLRGTAKEAYVTNSVNATCFSRGKHTECREDSRAGNKLVIPRVMYFFANTLEAADNFYSVRRDLLRTSRQKIIVDS